MSDSVKALAVDVGGSHATCAILEDRRLLVSECLPIPDAGVFGVLLPKLAATFDRLLQRCGLAPRACAGVAMSFPGIVDPFAGRIFATPKGKYDDARTLDLRAWSQERFGLPLRVENDARMALLGERHAGAARGFDDIVMVTLGTGVGGAAMMQGRLLRGRHYQAGLGGHLPILLDGRACICGASGCVEAEASTWALPEICRSWPEFASSALAAEPVLDFAALFQWSGRGDGVAAAIRDRCLRVWASGAIGLIHAFDPEVLVFGGAVMKSGDQVLPFVEKYIQAHAWTPWGRVRLRKAELGESAGLLGAIPLLKETC